MFHITLCVSDGKSGLVFGIPLHKCASNDADLRRGRTPPQREDSLDLTTPPPHHMGRSVVLLSAQRTRASKLFVHEENA